MENIWPILAKVLFGLVVSIIGYGVKLLIVQLMTIQKELAAINVQLAEVRNNQLTKNDVRDIVKAELYERGIK
jgi:hypothetical protein